MRPALGLVLLLALPAGAHVLPDPPDSCLASEAGAACKPMIGPTGTCTWLTRDERNAMELPGKARCEGGDGDGRQCVRYLMCVSDNMKGDTPALLARAETLIADRRIEEADALLRYLKWSERVPCDGAMAARWHRLGRAADAVRSTSSGFYYQAIGCDPGFYEPYFDLAAYWCSRPGKHPASMAAGAFLDLSRFLLNHDAPAAEWKALARRIEADPRLAALRGGPGYREVRERFEVGAKESALPHAYCRVEPRVAAARELKAEAMSCAVPEGATACPPLYLKRRAAVLPAVLSKCEPQDR